MPRKQLPRHSDSEWFRLITECRQSGLTDSHWCRINNIPVSSFFTAIRRLRTKSYTIPEEIQKSDNTLDLTCTQDVVEIDIKQDIKPAKYDETEMLTASVPVSSSYLDNSHTIEIQMGEAIIRLSNNADSNLVKLIMDSLMLGGHYAC